MKRSWEHAAAQTALLDQQKQTGQQAVQQMAQQPTPKRVPPPERVQQTARPSLHPREPPPRQVHPAQVTPMKPQAKQTAAVRPPLWRGSKGQHKELEGKGQHKELGGKGQHKELKERKEHNEPPLREPLPVGPVSLSQHGRPVPPQAISKAKMLSTAPGQSADTSTARAFGARYAAKQSDEASVVRTPRAEQQQNQKQRRPSPEPGHMVAKRGQGKKRPGMAAASQRDVEGQPLDEVLEPLNLGTFKDSLLRLGVESPTDLRYVTEEDFKGMRLNIIQRRKFEELIQRFS